MTDAPIDPDRQLGELVTENPALARELESIGIDYCCGGTQSLREACADAGLDVSAISERLAQARKESPDEQLEWDTMTDLVDDIVANHHEYLREELPELEALVSKVRSAHEENHPELRDVEETFAELSEEIRTHTREEETDVFPVIEKLEAGEPLDQDEAAELREAFADLEEDHDETAAHLERLAELTDDYAVPEDACPSYRSMLDRLEALERDTHMHVHKENNVLFVEAEQHLAEQSGVDSPA